MDNKFKFKILKITLMKHTTAIQVQLIRVNSEYEMFLKNVKMISIFKEIN